MSQQWSLSANLAGIALFDGPRVDLPKGAYRVKIESTEKYVKQATGNESIQFDLSVVEGPCAGAGLRTYVGADMTKDGNKRALKAALVSIGKKPEVLEQGVVRVENDTFEGKEAFVYVTPPEMPGPGAYSDIKFVSKARYEADRSAAGARAPGNGAEAPAAQGSAAIPPPTKAGADLMAGIKL